MAVKFKIKTLLLPMLLINISGCVSMLSHFKFSDSETKNQARNMAVVMTCIESGLTDRALGYSYAHAVSNIYTIAVYDKEIYEKAYSGFHHYFSNSTARAYEADCNRFNQEGPAVVTTLRTRYNEMLQRRQIDAVGMSASLSATGRASYSNYNYIPVAMPSNQVTFGQQSGPTTHHFLVDTGSGQRQCSVSNAGYVLCH